MPGGLCCGNLVRDILVRPVAEPFWGRTVWVDTIEEGFGGNGANTSYTLARLGTPVRLLGMLGADEAGDRIAGTLQSAGVGTTPRKRLAPAAPAPRGAAETKCRATPSTPPAPRPERLLRGVCTQPRAQ